MAETPEQPNRRPPFTWLLDRRRAQLALAVATLGTLVFLVVRFYFSYLFDPAFFVPLCFGALFAASLLFASARPRRLLAWIPPAAGIVVVTGLTLHAGIHLSQDLARSAGGYWDIVELIFRHLAGQLLDSYVSDDGLLLLITALVSAVFLIAFLLALLVSGAQRLASMPAPTRRTQTGLLLAVLASSLLALYGFVSGSCGNQMFPCGSVGYRFGFEKGYYDQWVAGNLHAMDEPSIWAGSKRDFLTERYRFTWLPSFDRPVAVRIDVPRSSTASVTTTILTGGGGPDHYEIRRKATSSHLSSDELEQVRRAFSRAGFWWMRSKEWPPASGLDGEIWIIEGAKGGLYQVVDRWSPRAGPVPEIGQLFMRLSDMREEDFTFMDGHYYREFFE